MAGMEDLPKIIADAEKAGMSIDQIAKSLDKAFDSAGPMGQAVEQAFVIMQSGISGFF